MNFVKNKRYLRILIGIPVSKTHAFFYCFPYNIYFEIAFSNLLKDKM